jgi:hypothetical protein
MALGSRSGMVTGAMDHEWPESLVVAISKRFSTPSLAVADRSTQPRDPSEKNTEAIFSEEVVFGVMSSQPAPPVVVQ